jgi:hypothetical protein
MCCGQKRSDLKSGATPDPTVINLLYCGKYPMQVRGSVTGQLYRFAQPRSVVPVHSHDAISMIRTQLFRQIP